METLKDIKNELVKRRELVLKIESDKNPSFDEMKKMFSKEFSVEEDRIDVYNIKGSFGKNTFLVEGYVYDSNKDLVAAIQKTGKQRKEEAKALLEAKKAEEEELKKKAEEVKAAA